MAWEILTEQEREAIWDKLASALTSMAIGVSMHEWKEPGPIPHWQLIVETAWCPTHSRDDISRALAQAKDRAAVDGPMNGVVLNGPRNARPNSYN
jgi:hypothetical protein